MNIKLTSEISLIPFGRVINDKIFFAFIYVGGDNPLRLELYLADEKERNTVRDFISEHNEFLKFNMRNGKSIMKIEYGENEHSFFLDDVYSCSYGELIPNKIYR